MSAQLLQVGRILTIVLSASLVAFIMGRFKRLTKRTDAPALWMLYWLFLFAQYVISLVSTITSIRDTYGSLLGRGFADLGQSLTLLLIAQNMPTSNQVSAQSHASRASIVVIFTAGAVAAIELLVWPTATDVGFQSVLGYVALSWLTARWVAFTAPAARSYLGLMLLIYAADYISTIGGQPAEGSVVAALRAAVLWLVYITIAYVCVYRLTFESMRAAATDDIDRSRLPLAEHVLEKADRGPAEKPPDTAADEPAGVRPAEGPAEPSPLATPGNVTIILNDTHALLYLWVQRSGKLALAVMAAMILSVIIAIIGVIPKFFTS